MTERINETAFKQWLKVTAGQARSLFVGMVNGAPVAEGNDHTKVALDTFDLAAQVGKRAKVEVYSSEAKIADPH